MATTGDFVKYGQDYGMISGVHDLHGQQMFGFVCCKSSSERYQKLVPMDGVTLIDDDNERAIAIKSAKDFFKNEYKNCLFMTKYLKKTKQTKLLVSYEKALPYYKQWLNKF